MPEEQVPGQGRGSSKLRPLDGAMMEKEGRKEGRKEGEGIARAGNSSSQGRKVGMKTNFCGLLTEMPGTRPDPLWALTQPVLLSQPLTL